MGSKGGAALLELIPRAPYVSKQICLLTLKFTKHWLCDNCIMFIHKLFTSIRCCEWHWGHSSCDCKPHFWLIACFICSPFTTQPATTVKGELAMLWIIASDITHTLNSLNHSLGAWDITCLRYFPLRGGAPSSLTLNTLRWLVSPFATLLTPLRESRVVDSPCNKAPG